MTRLEDFVAEMKNAHSPFDLRMGDAIAALQDLTARIAALETQVKDLRARRPIQLRPLF
jgi:hypothetical protein